MSSSNGWNPQEIKASNVSVIGASQTNSVASDVFPITAGGAIDGLVIKVSASAATVATGITAKLQTSIGATTWVDSKTVSITAAGDFYIKLLGNAAADQTYLPLLRSGRLVITTGAGDSITVSSIKVLQPL